MRAASWLVEALADDVYGLCRSMVRDPTVAEDLAQDAFSRALAGLSAFRGEASPRTWLLAIARHRCLDHLRRQRIRPDPLSDDDVSEELADPAPSEVSRVLCRSDVERGLMVLSETERALVVLRHGHGLSYAELARAFGIREGTVRMRVSRALKRMRAVLDEGDVCYSGVLESPPQSLPAPAPPPRRGAVRSKRLDRFEDSVFEDSVVQPSAPLESFSADEDAELDTLDIQDTAEVPAALVPPVDEARPDPVSRPAAPHLRRRAPASLRVRLAGLLP